MDGIDIDNPKYRLLLFCRAIGMFHNRDIERTFCLSNGYFNNMDNGINTDVLSRIVSVYPNLNLFWLLTGHGKMESAPTDGLYVAESDGKLPQESDYNIPIRSYTSLESIITSNSYMPPRWRMLPKRMVRNSNDIILKVVDDSLSPIFERDDYILFSPVIPSEAEGENIALCIFADDKILIRKARFLDDNHKIISLEPLNLDDASQPTIVCAASEISRFYIATSVFNF